MRTGFEYLRWGRVDLLSLLIAVIAVVVYALHGFNGYLSRDLAVYSYAGQQVIEGVPPYMAILNRAGPLAHLIPAVGVAGARIVGIDDLLGMRLLFMLIAAACVGVVYLLGRDLFKSRLAGVAAASALLSFSGFIEYASNGPREKTPMVLFMLCALWAITRQRWFTAGLFVSLATLVLQPVFPMGLAAMLVAALAVPAGQRLRALLRFAVGGLVPVVVFVVYFAAVGALREAIAAFLLINARYTDADPLMSEFTERWSRLEGGYGVSLWVMVVGLAGLAVISLMTLSRKQQARDDASMVVVAAMGAAALVGVVWSLRDFDDWPDAFLLLPLAATGIAGITKAIIRRLPRGAAVPITLVWAVTAVAIAASFSVTDRNDKLPRQRASVTRALAQLPPNASILSINAPQALVLSGKTNPTRYQTFSSGLDRYLDHTLPGGLQGFGAWIGREEPTAITLAGKPQGWLAETIQSEYKRVGRAPGWVWYVNRSVGHDTLKRLERRLDLDRRR